MSRTARRGRGRAVTVPVPFPVADAVVSAPPLWKLEQRFVLLCTRAESLAALLGRLTDIDMHAVGIP